MNKNPEMQDRKITFRLMIYITIYLFVDFQGTATSPDYVARDKLKN